MNNSQANNRIAKNTIFLYARLIFNVVVGLYTSRIVLKNLGVEDFGIYNLVGGFVSLLTIFTFSISGSSQRFIVFELGRGDKDKLSATFCTISVMLIFFSTLFFIFAGTIGSSIIAQHLNIPLEKRNIAVVVYFCSLAVFCLQLLAVPYVSLVIAHERMDFFAFMSVLETLAKLMVVISIDSVCWNKLVYYAVALAIISAIVRVLYTVYCRRCFVESKFHWTLRKDILKNFTSFTLWVGMGSFAGLLKDQGGSILINIFYGVTLNAACGIASQVRSHINQLSSNVGLAISPQITKSYSSGDVKRSIRLTFLLAKTQTLLMLLFVLPIIIEAPRLLSLWLGDVPDYAITFTRVALVLGVFQTLEMSYGTLFLAVGRVKKYQIFASIVTLTVLPSTYLCYSFGIHPSSYYFVCILVEVILFSFNYYYLKRIINFPLFHFFKDVFLKILLVATLPVIFIGILQPFTKNVAENYLQMIVNISVCMITFTILSYRCCFDKKERTVMINYITSKFYSTKNDYQKNYKENSKNSI